MEEKKGNTSPPLTGIRVLDWTAGQFGPVATVMLGDLGAEIIKLEQPKVGDPARYMQSTLGRSITGLPGGRNFYFESTSRSKRSITVDITKKKGQEIIYRLVKECDVFVNNYRLGVAAKVKLDYQTLSRSNPNLIYASANAFGPDGPDSDKPGFDYVAQARSGIMAAVGGPGMAPQPVPGAIADQIGAVFLGYGIVLALLAKERLGIGQEVNVSLLGSMIAAQGVNVAASTILGSEFVKHERDRAGNPLWNHYQCADGKWISLAMFWSDRCWPDFCGVAGIDNLKNDAKFNSMDARWENSQELISILDNVFASKARNEWIKIFDDAISQGRDIVYSIVNTISDLQNDQQVIANKYITPFDHPKFGKIKVVGIPFKFSQTPGVVGGQKKRSAPDLGEHNEEVLMEIGYTLGDIKRLRDEGVI